jgi:hypothetical protein
MGNELDAHGRMKKITDEKEESSIPKDMGGNVGEVKLTAEYQPEILVTMEDLVAEMDVDLE